MAILYLLYCFIMSFDPRYFYPSDTDDTQRPPLLPPIASAAPLRPSPLEPNARTDDDSLHNVKFTHTGPISPSQTAPLIEEASTLPAYVDPADLKNRPRKWQKLDFYQLPKPSNSSLPAAATGAAPLPPILILNDLHQPPPSAALFPPITENEAHGQSQDAVPSIQDTSETRSILNNRADSTTVGTNWRKQKRVQSRGRVHWTEQETADLLEGVKKYGLGRWKNILIDEDFHFNPRRTGIDLKDRYRTYCIAKDRAKAELAESKQPSARGGNTQQLDTPARQNQTEPVPGSRLISPSQPSDSSSRVVLTDDSMRTLKVKFENYSIADFKSWNGAGLPTFEENNLARFARWPAIDDAKLERGFRKHGFKWSLIASDPEIGLGHRTAAKIRDRFRIIFPQNYRDNNPLLPTSMLNTDIDIQETGKKANDNVSMARSTRNPGRQDLDDSTEDHAFTLPPLNRDLWKTTQSSDTISPSSSTTRAKPPPAVYATDAINWLQPGNQELNLDYEDARGINLDSLDDDLDFGGQLAPLRYPYDQDWTEDGFDSSLQLPPMMLFPPETDDA